LVIPVVAEELYVGKRAVRAGVQVEVRVVSVPVERTISIVEEDVRVERRPVDRLADCQPDVFKERILEMKVLAEEPVVTKRARVVEVVRIQKQRRERVETVRDTLRQTQVDVIEEAAEPSERFDPARYDEHFRRVYEPQQVSFESVAPAYEFGERLRRHSTHGDWSAIESGVSRRWEQRNPGTWERFRDAIRKGWESMTSH
jgi:hypothetical protein